MIYDTWWFWVAIGLVLIILETMLPGFVLLGFGVGAICVGIMVALGLSLSVPKLLLIFAALSLACWAIFRILFRPKKSNIKTFEHDINDDVHIEDP